MTVVSFAAYWCHAHQAWCYTARVYRQDGDELMDQILMDDVSLGPFDGADGVLAAFEGALAAAVTRIG